MMQRRALTSRELILAVAGGVGSAVIGAVCGRMVHLAVPIPMFGSLVAVVPRTVILLVVAARIRRPGALTVAGFAEALVSLGLGGTFPLVLLAPVCAGVAGDAVYVLTRAMRAERVRLALAGAALGSARVAAAVLFALLLRMPIKSVQGAPVLVWGIVAANAALGAASGVVAASVVQELKRAGVMEHMRNTNTDAKAASTEQFVVKPVGYVRSTYQAPTDVRHRHDRWTDELSEITLLPKRARLLEGLKGYSHIIVLFWVHRWKEWKMPKGHHKPPHVNVFATRMPVRPNPIGMSVVELVDFSPETGKLIVRGLDGVDGTPVLDIKPYIANFDSYPDARVPDWITTHLNSHFHSGPGDQHDHSHGPHDESAHAVGDTKQKGPL